MPHTTILRKLARRAARNVAREGVSEAASEFWDLIARDDRLPSSPYPEDFRKAAFKAFGEATKGKSSRGSKTRSGSRSRTRGHR